MSDFKNISDFRKSKSSKYSYQDPTYLSFLLMFDFHDNANSPLLSGAAENFIEKLGPQYSDSLKALKDFIKSLKIINNELPWYWQSISGLDRIQKYQPENPYFGGDEAMITISTLESLNLPSAGLMYLYKKAAFDIEKWNYILPANLRKFRVYVYVSEVRTIKNISKPSISGANLNDFPSNFKPSIGIDNKNSEISGTEGRPYFMFSLGNCEWNMESGTTAFAELNKSPESNAVGEIQFMYETLNKVEARVLNGIIDPNTDIMAPAPDSENKSYDSLGDWAKDFAVGKLKDLKDRAVQDLKTTAINRMQELQAEAKRQTVGRLNATVNNAYQDFVNRVDGNQNPVVQENNIKAAIADNVHGLIEGENNIETALQQAAAKSLGNVYEQ